jgi:hypothetical protein
VVRTLEDELHGLYHGFSCLRLGAATEYSFGFLISTRRAQSTVGLSQENCRRAHSQKAAGNACTYCFSLTVFCQHVDWPLLVV